MSFGEILYWTIGFIGSAITITYHFNHLLQLIIGDCLRLVPFPPGLRASSLPLWVANNLISEADEFFSLTNLFTLSV
jgi:hypothetical protein